MTHTSHSSSISSSQSLSMPSSQFLPAPRGPFICVITVVTGVHTVAIFIDGIGCLIVRHHQHRTHFFLGIGMDSGIPIIAISHSFHHLRRCLQNRVCLHCNHHRCRCRQSRWRLDEWFHCHRRNHHRLKSRPHLHRFRRWCLRTIIVESIAPNFCHARMDIWIRVVAIQGDWLIGFLAVQIIGIKIPSPSWSNGASTTPPSLVWRRPSQRAVSVTVMSDCTPWWGKPTTKQ